MATFGGIAKIETPINVQNPIKAILVCVSGAMKRRAAKHPPLPQVDHARARGRYMTSLSKARQRGEPPGASTRGRFLPASVADQRTDPSHTLRACGVFAFPSRGHWGILPSLSEPELRGHGES
jgi:hypothetical protein